MKELKRLAIPCKFGSAFEERLRDQLVVGVLDEHLIKRLLSEERLDTFQKAVEIALNTEWATHTAKRVKDHQAESNRLEVDVNLVRPRKPQGSGQRPAAAAGKKCYCCGVEGHMRITCRSRNKYCSSCGRKGHLEKMCRGGQQKSTQVNEVDNEEAENQDPASERYALEISSVHQTGADDGAHYVPPHVEEVVIQNKSLKLLCDMVPPFNKARSVPFARRKQAEEALEKMVRQGVLKPVRFAEAAAPVVYTPKGDDEVRLCADLRTTANKVTRLEQYPLPRAEDLFASRDMREGTRFSKLDLKDAYSQLEMHPRSRWLTTINTHRGLFEYNRVPNGVSSAPAFFQRSLEAVLAGIPGTGCRLDDILISGPPEDHMKRLREVLGRMRKFNLKLGKKKCQFMEEEIEFLGHKLNSKGLRPLESKVRAIEKAPRPTSREQVQSFLGMISYYAKFIPDRASSLAPLYELMQREKPFKKGEGTQ